MWKSLCSWLVLVTFAIPVHAEDLSASELLDEAILWPGDFSQVCSSDGDIGPRDAPHLPGYGSFLIQDYFLSEAMIARLQTRRAEVVVELNKRLQAFDWEHVPAPGPVPKRITRIKDKGLAVLRPDAPGPGPWRPQNTHALGGAMLEIIQVLNAVEVIPEVLRLEDQLNAINELAAETTWQLELSRAAKPPAASKLPPIDLAGRTPDWQRTEIDLDIPKGAKWSQWRQKLYDHLVFQHNLLGVCLGMVEHNKYAPLKNSLVGRLHNLGLRREGLIHMDRSRVDTKEKLKTSDAKDYLHWDDALDVPLADDEQVNIPWSTAVRDSARAVLVAFSKGALPTPELEGASLLEAVIRTPGNFSQMCFSPPPLPLNVPIAPTANVARHYYSFSSEVALRIQANRAGIIAPLLGCLQRMDVKQPPKPDKNRSSDTLNHLMLDVIRLLNAVETLPELLRLEADLHELITRAEKEPDFTPPRPDIDSPVSWQDKATSKDADRERTAALFACRVLQREVLGLIWQLLVAEDFAPLRQASVEKQFQAAGRQPLRAKLESVKSWDELYLMHQSSELIGKHPIDIWDRKKQKLVLTEASFAAIDYRADIPWAETARAEMRAVAEEFLRVVPVAKRQAGDAMPMRWLRSLPRNQ